MRLGLSVEISPIDRRRVAANNIAVTIWDDMQSDLDELDARDLLRRPAVLDSPVGPRVRVNGRDVVCLCSNDYLGLAADPAVRAAAVEAIARWGVGAGASRLVCGTMRPHEQLERALAEFKGAEAALVTSTGWAANHVTIAAMAGRGDLVLCDKLNHASILDAAAACGAEMRTYVHRDMARLRRLLESRRRQYRRCLIVTDSLFSMDGDLAPLAELADLRERYDAQLLIDEAHATGVLGEHGRGAAELLGVEGRVDAVVGTLSKALGTLGGFVAGPRVLVETIRNRGRAFIYTTAPPPALCAAAAKALEIVKTRPELRRKLNELAADCRAMLTEVGLDTLDSQSQIIPVVIGDAGAAMRLSGALLDAGFLIPAIRPPTVPPGTSRLRLSISAAHERNDLERLPEFLKSVLH